VREFFDISRDEFARYLAKNTGFLKNTLQTKTPVFRV